jgi:hypothetical protein
MQQSRREQAINYSINEKAVSQKKQSRLKRPILVQV